MIKCRDSGMGERWSMRMMAREDAWIKFGTNKSGLLVAVLDRGSAPAGER